MSPQFKLYRRITTLLRFETHLRDEQKGKWMKMAEQSSSLPVHGPRPKSMPPPMEQMALQARNEARKSAVNNFSLYFDMHPGFLPWGHPGGGSWSCYEHVEITMHLKVIEVVWPMTKSVV